MTNEVVLPYRPRPWFKAMHASQKRWIVTVAHRRAGKTVAQVNHLIRAALTNTRAFPPPQYAYVAPSFAQAKDLAWNYLAQYTSPIAGMRFLETELSCTFPTGAKIKLFGGAQAYERIRGMYFDGAVLDEYALLNPEAFHVVVRPALADYGGFALISGTAQGRDHFWEIYDHARRFQDTWDAFTIPVTETTALHPDEVEEIKRTQTDNQFAREMLCSFDAPVEGSYYGDIIVDLQMKGRITKVPYAHEAGVITAWDLGMHDNTSIWFAQRIGREIRIIDFLQDKGKPLDWYVQQLQMRGYTYNAHILPHDVKVREMGTGRSRYEVLEQLGVEVTVAPDHKVDDGIAAVRSLLPDVWIDEASCAEGITALKAYQSAPAQNLGTAHARPLHNWSSHAADAFRYLAVGLDMAAGWASSTTTWGDKFRKWKIPGLA